MYKREPDADTIAYMKGKEILLSADEDRDIPINEAWVKDGWELSPLQETTVIKYSSSYVLLSLQCLCAHFS